MAIEHEDPQAFVKVTTVARYLQVGPETVRRLTARRGLPAHRFGGNTRYRLCEIDAWIAEQNASERE